jgi:hypothetical protein
MIVVCGLCIAYSRSWQSERDPAQGRAAGQAWQAARKIRQRQLTPRVRLALLLLHWKLQPQSN